MPAERARGVDDLRASNEQLNARIVELVQENRRLKGVDAADPSFTPSQTEATAGAPGHILLSMQNT